MWLNEVKNLMKRMNIHPDVLDLGIESSTKIGDDEDVMLQNVYRGGRWLKTPIKGMIISVYNSMCVIINDDKELLVNEIFEYDQTNKPESTPYGLIVTIKGEHISNVLKPNGSYLFDQWFSYLEYYESEKLFFVRNKQFLYNVISSKTGKLLFNWRGTPYTIKYVRKHDLYYVQDAPGKWHYIDEYGNETEPKVK